MRISLIEDLLLEPLPKPLPTVTNFLVEFDPTSPWLSASLTIAAEWIKGGEQVSYTSLSRPPESLRSPLRKLGLNVDELEKNQKLSIWDWYTVKLGRKSQEKFAIDSLKVADLSIWMSKAKPSAPIPERLRIKDDLSVLGRFNDERAWVEFELTRAFPLGTPYIIGIVRGVHSDWAYKTLEAAVDGVIDFKADEAGEEVRSLIRIRFMRDVPFDSRWHVLKVGKNFEIILEK